MNLANTPLPVSGSVTVGNLPLDSNGNVLVDAVPDTTQYQYVSIVASTGNISQCQNSYGVDFCTYNGTQWTPIEQVLTTLGKQGYELFSVVSTTANGAGGATMLYTLRAPVKGAHKKASPVQ